MDSLTQAAAQLAIVTPQQDTAAAAADAAVVATAPSSVAVAAHRASSLPPFVLHVLDLSGTTEDASIELSTAASNYMPLQWETLEAAQALTVQAVKQRVAAMRQRSSTEQEQTAEAVTSVPALAGEDLPLNSMRLVFLTQRVAEAASSAGAAADGATALLPPSSCRPLTDLSVDARLLCEYGVASHSWLLLKRKRVQAAAPQQTFDDDEEEEYGDEEEDDVESYEDAHEGNA